MPHVARLGRFLDVYLCIQHRCVPPDWFLEFI